MLTRKIERDNEEFVVALSEDKMSATVTDEKASWLRSATTLATSTFGYRMVGGLGCRRLSARSTGQSGFASSRENS